MKKSLPILFMLLTVFAFSSCMSMLEISRNVELGMTKEQVIKIMGKNYFVESMSQTDEGKLEVLHFKTNYYPYLCYFLDATLIEFHRYISPNPTIKQEIKVSQEKKEE